MKELNISQSWYWFLLAAACCYLIGCFNFAVLISKIKKQDIRGVGSGNPGTMNMSRTFGLKIGIINFLCDALKGGIPVLCGYFIFRGYVFEGTNVNVGDFARYFFGVFAVIGHIFPVTMKFKGGKGIASTLGLFWFSLACETWWFIFIGLLVFVALFGYIALTEWGSMGSLLGVSSFTIWQGVIFWTRYQAELTSGYVIAIFAILLLLNILTWVAHHKNLFRLMSGEEHHTSVKKMLKKKKKPTT
jgi:glycerol-3-phosphate acyltransferase PlsY